MSIRPEVLPFLAGVVVAAGLLVLILRLLRTRWRRAGTVGAVFAVVMGAYMLYFFRDPDRTAPEEPFAVVAAADGTIAGITELTPERFRAIAASSGLAGEGLAGFLEGQVLRISIFLSLFDVHVNRAPVSGEFEFLGYFPGKRFFTFQDKSSELNQHNAILIRNSRTRCLVNQIVGPVCRRVVYWPDHDRRVRLEKGRRIGMMKFGSRLDMYFPGEDVTMVVEEGARVRAGETVVGRMVKRDSLSTPTSLPRG